MRKMLAITDVTRMQGTRVCIAGVDQKGVCVRPVLSFPVEEYHLYFKRKPVIFPKAKIELDLSPAESIPPHIEDEVFDPATVVNLGVFPDSQWESILIDICFPSLEDIFDGFLEDGRKVRPGSETRSLGTIGNVEICDIEVDGRFDRQSYRLEFRDVTGKLYKMPVNDLAFRRLFEGMIGDLDSAPESETAMLEKLRGVDRVYLRIGLARPNQIGDHAEACWTQVTAIYTFPDYLQGRTFADFV